MKRFCVGMAVHKDFEGAVQTIQAIRLALDLNDILYGTDHFRQTEFVVIGNSPGSDHDRHLAEFVANIGGVFASCDIEGTSAPRNMIFEVSSAEFVLAMDCHLELRADTVSKLWDWWEHHSDAKWLVSGPMLTDALVAHLPDGTRRWSIMATHMDDLWNDRMWGVWGRIWECPFGGRFSVIPDKDGNCQAIKLEMQKPATGHVLSPVRLDGIPYRQGYEAVLLSKGFLDWGQSDSGHYTDVPGMGLGLFTCRRDAWLGFPKECRGFGAEEMNIHEKFRAAGARVICLDFLKWWHRFWRQRTDYAPKTAHTVANHFAWAKDRNDARLPMLAHAHYVGGGYLPQSEWDAAKEGKIVASKPVSVGTRHGRPQPENPQSVDELFEWACLTPRDLNNHLPQLREMASRCKHVTEFTTRRESRIGLASGFPEKLISYSTEEDEIYATLEGLLNTTQLPSHFGRPRTCVFTTGEDADSIKVGGKIEETDMLFIDTVHTGDRFRAELELYHKSVRRWIVRHDTEIYSTKGSDGGPGLVLAIRDFLDAHPEWFVVSHTKEQHGLTVLGKLEKDRPEKPIRIWPKGYGPGTEFEKIVLALDLKLPNCGGCKTTMRMMDEAGVEGMREPSKPRKLQKLKVVDGKQEVEHFERDVSLTDLAVEQIEERMAEWGWSEPIAKMFEKKGLFGAIQTVRKSGLLWEMVKEGGLNPTEVAKRPIPALVRIAIARAEKAESENPSCPPGKTCAKGECKGTCKTNR